MQLPDYVTIEEVQRVCRELHIRDWTAFTKAKVDLDEAKVILKIVNTEEMAIQPEDFCSGLEVELEHGLRFKDANVTNNHPILTGKIVLAHLKESMEYYKRLEVVELEGDLYKAILGKDSNKITSLYKRILDAKKVLCDSELEKLNPK